MDKISDELTSQFGATVHIETYVRVESGATYIHNNYNTVEKKHDGKTSHIEVVVKEEAPADDDVSSAPAQGIAQGTSAQGPAQSAATTQGIAQGTSAQAPAQSAATTQPPSAQAPSAQTPSTSGGKTSQGHRRKRELCFRDYVIDKEKADSMMALFHRMLDGRYGVAVTRFLQVAAHIGVINGVPPFSVVTREFGDIGARNGFYRALRTHFTQEEQELAETIMHNA